MVKVLLFSGGLDSFCLNYLIKPDIRVYIDVGTEDGKKEIENVKKMPFKTHIINFDLSEFELDNKIIPFRNAFFVLLAAQYGNEIYLGATAGDTTKDKDYVFKAQMESFLNYFGLDKEKVKLLNYPYEVRMPFKEMTKTEIVRKYVSNADYITNINNLREYSRSCYKGGDLECGLCRNCIRKAIALVNNDISITDEFEHDPFKSITKEFHMKQLKRGMEGQEYIRALERLNLYDYVVDKF